MSRLFLGVGEARSVDGSRNTDVGLWLRCRVGYVNCVVDVFLVCWLKLSSVTTFGLIDFSIVVLSGLNLEIDVGIGVSLVWNLDVDVCVLGLVFLRSFLDEEREISWRRCRKVKVTMSTKLKKKQ